MSDQNYYNENDPFAAQWLRNLIEAKLIPAGHVDQRSIVEVQPSDLAGYVQCHFFAGIGGWACALQLAGWPDDVPVWTGSCPCQPLSCAGKRAGEMDERHLWPDYYRLIAQCRPATVFGEQVASSDGLEWLDGISLDLEEIEYAVGAADLPAACEKAPEIRQRLWWVAQSIGVGIRGSRPGTITRAASGVQGKNGKRKRLRVDAGASSDSVVCGLANTGPSPARRDSGPGCADAAIEGVEGERQRQADTELTRCGEADRMGNSDSERQDGERIPILAWRSQQACSEAVRASEGCGLGDTECDGLRIGRRQDASQPHQSSYWSLFELVFCEDEDGCVRRVEPGTFPLAYGVPASMGRGQPELFRMAKLARANRSGRLAGYGNAIVPQVAAEFIRAYIDCLTTEQTTRDEPNG